MDETPRLMQARIDLDQLMTERDILLESIEDLVDAIAAAVREVAEAETEKETGR